MHVGDGSHGILYACGDQTSGQVYPQDTLESKRVRTIYGSYDQFVAIVDGWALAWKDCRTRSQVLENETVIVGFANTKIQQVAFGDNHRVALSLDGEIFSWGTRGTCFTHGQLGQVGSGWLPVAVHSNRDKKDRVAFRARDEMQITTTNPCQPRRVHVPKGVAFAKVACGGQHSVAVTQTGDLYAWGRNVEGQLGHGQLSLPGTPTNTDRAGAPHNRLHISMCAWPKYVTAFLGKPPVVDVCCGDVFTVALLADGSMYGCGERFTGVTHHPEEKADASLRLLATHGTDGAPFKEVVAGLTHALALTASGELFAWGLNVYGQLGLGAIDDKDRNLKSTSKPHPIPSASGPWARIFAGGYYSAALSFNGKLHTWGNGTHGQLGHGVTTHEPSPRLVEALQGVTISSVVCAHRQLYAFAPTSVTAISPTAGELKGGYQLRIQGSGFWQNEDLTVRFIPRDEGRLPRGSLGEFDAHTGEVVCVVPAFTLPGDFAVEVAINGRNFTTDGHIFEVFKPPAFTAVSRDEARLAGGEEIEVTVDGRIPRSCREPLLRFRTAAIQWTPPTQDSTLDLERELSDGCNNDMGTAQNEKDAGVKKVCVETELTIAGTAHQTECKRGSVVTTALRFQTPAFPSVEHVLNCTMEVSYNGGSQFIPVVVASTGVSKDTTSLKASGNGNGTYEAQPKRLLQATLPTHDPQQHIVTFHDATVQRVQPNSFLAQGLPQLVEVDVHHLPRGRKLDQLSVRLEVTQALAVSEPGADARVHINLPIQHAQADTLSCLVPPLHQWILTKIDSKSQQRVAITTDWWKFVPRWGFETTLQVSLNNESGQLPTASSCSSSVYCLMALGRLLSIFPSAGPMTGQTQISIASDYFHFDSHDAVVKLRWRDQREARVKAMCAFPSESILVNSAVACERRLVFETPPIPSSFTMLHTTTYQDDNNTNQEQQQSNEQGDSPPLQDSTVPIPTPEVTETSVGTTEEVEILVSLDGGAHFHSESPSLRFTYCTEPKLKALTPTEAEPGVVITLQCDVLVAAASAGACVRLMTLTHGLSTVVPVSIDESQHTASFCVPVLPIPEEDMVIVLFSLDGQQFIGESRRQEGETPLEGDAATGMDTEALKFHYVTPSIDPDTDSSTT